MQQKTIKTWGQHDKICERKMRHVVKNYKNVSEEVESRVEERLDNFNKGRKSDAGHYAIRTGVKSAMFTLWNVCYFEGMNGRSTSENFIRILGKDFEESVEKAMELVANRRKALFVEETDTIEYSYDKEVFCFGKYKGQSISSVAQSDIKYLFFLKEKRNEFVNISKTMEGNFDNIEAQIDFYFDTITKENQQSCASVYLGERGQKLGSLQLTIEKVFIGKRDPYECGMYQSEYYEEIIANDINGNRVRMRFECGTKNFKASNAKGKWEIACKVGDTLKIKSARIAATFESLGRKTTALNYVRFE